MFNNNTIQLLSRVIAPKSISRFPCSNDKPCVISSELSSERDARWSFMIAHKAPVSTEEQCGAACSCVAITLLAWGWGTEGLHSVFRFFSMLVLSNVCVSAASIFIWNRRFHWNCLVRWSLSAAANQSGVFTPDHGIRNINPQLLYTLIDMQSCYLGFSNISGILMYI